MEPDWLECRSKRKYSPLFSFQKRLRHLKGISFRNLMLPEACQVIQLRLVNFAGEIIYDSEPIPATNNPGWKNLKVNGKPTSKDVTVQILGDERLILEWRLYFSGLVFISRHLPDVSLNFAPNSMLVLFTEGVYCDKTCFDICDKDENISEVTRNNAYDVYVNPDALCDVRCSIRVDARQLKRSYGINSLNRLYTNERAIIRTACNAHTLRDSLESRIKTKLDSEELRSMIETTRIRCRVLRSLIEERLHMKERERRQLIIEEKVITQKRNELVESKDMYDELKENLAREREKLKELKRELSSLPLLERQITLICQLDDYIYPVRQTAQGYTVCSLLVPSSLSDLRDPKKNIDDQVLSTGMAYVFHLVSMLSTFTGIPCIYPLKYERNYPVVVDVTFDSFHHKEFPLWVKGKDRLYFEHAFPLLALNVGDLRVQFGLPSMRGKLMAGLWGLVKHFRKVQKKHLGLVDEGESDISCSNLMLADDWMSPCASSTPEQSSPDGTPRLSMKIHSVPNLISHSGDSLEVDPGAASDHIS